MTIQRIDFLGLPLDTGVTVDEVCALLSEKGRARLVTFVGPASWALAKRQPEFTAALQKMDRVLPESLGVIGACWLLSGLLTPRISFDLSVLGDSFFKKAQKEKASLMLVGGRPGEDEQVHDKLLLSYPELKIAGSAHGFGELGPKAALVVEKAPDAVLVSMGAAREVLFLLALREAGYKGLAIACGDFFERYRQAAGDYPKWIDTLHLRFAWRLMKEPARLWRHYFIDYQLFAARVIRALAEKAYKLLRAQWEKLREKLRAAR